MHHTKPIILCILDGWGYREGGEDNAIAAANTPCWDELIANCPHSLLETSGLAVGLPEGQMGNSEVGHMNIGSGRIVMQDLPRIDQAIKDGSLIKSNAYRALVTDVKQSKGVCHLLGLLSDGGVHAHQNHIEYLAKDLASQDIGVKLHLFLDGRDTPPNSAQTYFSQLLQTIEGNSNISIATIGGRFFGMDRDQRWERVEQAYNAIIKGQGEQATDPLTAITDYYAQDKTDEFIPPTVIGGYQGVNDGDALFIANFRADRVRQLTQALVDPTFDGFDRSKQVNFVNATIMTQYAASLLPYVHVLFPQEPLEHILGEVIANHGKTQLRVAETEKYAHVTFFFNGGKEEVFPGERRELIPSPKVATYDLQPAMSAPQVTDKLVEAMEDTDVIVVNFANTDMVGHTGNFDAAKQAVETVDQCLARIVEKTQQTEGVLLITADHGNAEMMQDPNSGAAYTAHTINPVPFIYCSKDNNSVSLRDGKLCDIAPTILNIMQIDVPPQMTGTSLLIEK